MVKQIDRGTRQPGRQGHRQRHRVKRHAGTPGKQRNTDTGQTGRQGQTGTQGSQAVGDTDRDTGQKDRQEGHKADRQTGTRQTDCRKGIDR